MLKNGSAVQEVLQECPQITILFCYITGFKELTTSCDPYDVVDFVNSLFSSFDKVKRTWTDCNRSPLSQSRYFNSGQTDS